MTENIQKQTEDMKLTWVEPSVQQLDVRETAFQPLHGNDGGGSAGTDCTHS